VIVDDLDGDRGGFIVGPLEANAPMVVGANAVLTLTMASECFEPVAWTGRDGLKGPGGFEEATAAVRLALDGRERVRSLARREPFRSPDSIPAIHPASAWAMILDT
jgi:hypothetical protein